MEKIKIENLDLRTRFFVQYYGQKVMYVGGVGIVEVGKGGWNLKHPDFFLELKPLSMISDEDAIDSLPILGGKKEVTYTPEDLIEIKDSLIEFIEADMEDLVGKVKIYSILNLFDFLRSKGYALPFMGLSVEQMIEYGWIKLK